MGLTRPTAAQINTVITTISDPITVLNKGSTLANIDVGFIINRNGGTLANTAIFWNESANTFVTAFTAASGAADANISISEYANLRVGTLTATFVNTTGNIVSGGNVTAPYFFGNGSQLSGVITSVTKIINGTSDVTAYPDSNIAVTVGGTANTVVFTSSNIYVAGSILPTANIAYDLGSPTNRFRTGYFSANTIDIGGGTIGLHDTLGFTFTTPGGNPQYMMPNGASTSNTFTSGTVTIQGNLAVNGNVTTIGNVSGQYILGSAQFLTGLTGSGTALTGINSFGNIFISGQSPVLADNTSDTLTLVAGSGITITTDAANDSVTFTTVSTLGAFGADADFGLVTDAVTLTEDQGDLASTSSTTYDLGTLVAAAGLIYPDQLVLPSYTVSTLPSASVAAQLVYVSDETGGAVLAFSDGTNWRRITDRAIVS